MPTGFAENSIVRPLEHELADVSQRLAPQNTNTAALPDSIEHRSPASCTSQLAATAPDPRSPQRGQ
eukprot:4289737-Alexandrium_andersonii.AAC.1